MSVKKYLCSFVIYILTVPLFAGCKDVVYPIWDFPPHNIGLIIRTPAGDDLLDPETENNILENNVTAVYRGETYEMWDARTAQTRYIPSTWFGLRIGKYWHDDDNGDTALLFGEFSADTTDGYHEETVTIDWGDGTSDEIKFDLYVTYRKKGKESTVHRSIWLNGELQSDDSLVVTIVK